MRAAHLVNTGWKIICDQQCVKLKQIYTLINILTCGIVMEFRN
jgi:hypothetical protein